MRALVHSDEAIDIVATPAAVLGRFPARDRLNFAAIFRARPKSTGPAQPCRKPRRVARSLP